MRSCKVGGGAYRGMAPGVKVVNVKVLNNDGRGTASHVITGLAWRGPYYTNCSNAVAALHTHGAVFTIICLRCTTFRNSRFIVA